MYQMIRIVFAALAAWVSADYMVDGINGLVGDLYLDGSPRWADRAQAGLYGVCILIAFFFWLNSLVHLPRLSVSVMAAYITVGPIAGKLFWVLGLNGTPAAHPFLYGYCTFLVFLFWYRLLDRVPKLYWLR